MKVLYKSDSDYIVLPSKDPFVQKNQAFLIEMGYKLIEDWEPPTISEPTSEVTETVTETVEETVEETAEETVTINGKTYTKSELKKLIE